MKKSFLLLFGTLIPLISQAQTLHRDTIRMEPVTITSTMKTEVSRNQFPLTVSVISRQEIESSGETALLSVLTGRVPGVFVTERSTTGFGVSNGSAGTVNIRGVGSGNKVLMLLDGQPQWAGVFGHHIPDNYVSSDVERVEVIRGPASLLYGSNAMGGAVNVITRKTGQDGFHGQGQVQYGSYNTQKYQANGSFQKGKTDAFLSINHDRTDGHRENSAFHITNGFGKVGYAFSDHWRVSGEVMAAKFKTNNPGTVQTPAVDNWADVLRITYSLSLENDYGKTSGGIKAFYNYGDHEVNDGWRNGAPREYLFQLRDRNAGVMVYQSVRLFEGNLLTGGVDYKNFGGRAWQRFEDRDGPNQVDTTINETAVYLATQQTLGKRLTLHGGVRLEMNEAYGNEWVPQGGLSWQASSNTILKASVAKGFRSPNLRDLYMYGTANADLNPESMVNYDISWLQSFMHNSLNIELTAFYIDGKDMIQTTPVDGSTVNMNIGSFRNKGIEFGFDYRITSGWRLSGSYSYLDLNRPVLGAPKHIAFLEVLWRPGRFSVNVNAQHVGDLYTLATRDAATDTYTTKQDSYTLLNARVAYAVSKHLTCSVHGENLTAARYEIYDGYPMAKATVMAGVSVRF